jgi:protease-4
MIQQKIGPNMSTETDLLMERRRGRRQTLLWKVLAIVAATALGAVLVVGGKSQMLSGESGSIFAGKHVARIDVHGLILEDRWRDNLISDLKDDDSVKAVIVSIDSPGGTVVGGENLYIGLRALAEKKPVVAVMGSTGTSAAYMTAIATDRIFVRQGTLTGSIGVLMQTADVTGMLDKLGVKPETIKSGPFKAQPNPLEHMTDATRAHIQGVIMDMYDMFVDMVAERRAMKVADTKKLADGRVFTGRQALKLGLVDAIGGENEARDWLASDKSIDRDLPVIEAKPDYPQPLLLQRVFGAFTGAFGKALLSERLTLDGLLSVWHPAL